MATKVAKIYEPSDLYLIFQASQNAMTRTMLLEHALCTWLFD